MADDNKESFFMQVIFRGKDNKRQKGLWVNYM